MSECETKFWTITMFNVEKNPNKFQQLNQQKYGIIDAIRFFVFMGSFFKSVILM